MKKNQVKLKRYLMPQCEIIQLNETQSLLAGSEIRPTPGVGNPSIQVGDNNNDEEELEFD